MNRIIATTGVAAVGALTLLPMGAQEAKPWNINASVRSFYDDNYATLPSRATAPGRSTKRSTWGLELSPSGSYQFSRDQTTLLLNSRYSMRYFEDRTSGSANHSFDFGADLTHRFTEKQRLSLTESFAIAQEPGVLDPSSAVSTALLTLGNNLRNTIQAKYFWDDIVERWSGEASYSNTYIDYQQDNSSAGGSGSRSALLDRVENNFTLAGRYRIFDETETELLLGYTLGTSDSTSKDSILVSPLGVPVTPDSRNRLSHYFFSGLGHKFTPTLRMNGRLGVQYAEYPNASKADAGLLPGAPYARSVVSPYVDANGTWEYLPNSTFQVGASVNRITTDLATSVDAQATTFYTSLNHEFVPELRGSLLAQIQQSEYRQSVAPRDVSDLIFTMGANLEWRFSQFWSVEGGYNYDRQDSDIGGRSYYRNRVYMGFKASF
ncbi:MAG: putative beta-barrel porin 2 [Verrucomicrobiota bacterium]|jgi:hypothetical protein